MPGLLLQHLPGPLAAVRLLQGSSPVLQMGQPLKELVIRWPPSKLFCFRQQGPPS